MYKVLVDLEEAIGVLEQLDIQPKKEMLNDEKLLDDYIRYINMLETVATGRVRTGKEIIIHTLLWSKEDRNVH